MSAGQIFSVVLVDREPASREAAKNYLSQMGARIVGEADSLVMGLSLVHGHRPDILFLELPSQADQALELVRGLKDNMPDMGIVITARDASPQLILRCMRAGAQEFLARPLNNRELGEAVQRLAGMIQRAQAPKKQPGKIITVFSNKGGVGVTSIATNLAVSFAQNAKMTTALVDLNMQMGEVGFQLDLHPKYTIADAINTSDLDESRLKGLLTEHESGMYFLSTPDDPVELEKIFPDLLIEVFNLLSGMFDVIVVDAGHVFDSRVLEVMNMADSILVVAGLDVATVRNIRRCITLFDQLGYTQQKVRLIVNREQRKGKVALKDLEDTAKSKVFWQIPGDYKSMISAIDAGVPAVMQNPKAKISRSFEDLTYELCRLHGLDGGGEGSREPEESDDSLLRFVKIR